MTLLSRPDIGAPSPNWQDICGTDSWEILDSPFFDLGEIILKERCFKFTCWRKCILYVLNLTKDSAQGTYIWNCILWVSMINSSWGCPSFQHRQYPDSFSQCLTCVGCRWIKNDQNEYDACYCFRSFSMEMKNCAGGSRRDSFPRPAEMARQGTYRTAPWPASQREGFWPVNSELISSDLDFCRASYWPLRQF